MRWKWFVLGVCFAASLVFIPCGYLHVDDDRVRLLQTKAILFNRSIDIPEYMITSDAPTHFIAKGIDGKRYGRFGIGLPILWLAPVSLAYLAHVVSGAPLDKLAGLFVSTVNVVIVWLLMLSIALVLKRVGYGARARGLSILAFLTLTTTLAYMNSSYSEPLVGLILFWALFLPVLRGFSRGTCLAAGCLVSYAILVKPDMIILVPSLALMFTRRPGLLFLFLVGAALAPGSVLLDNYLARGAPFAFAYGNEASFFQSPVEGLTGYFLDAEKNLLLFHPVLLIGPVCWLYLGRAFPLKSVAAPAVALLATFIFFYASWWGWYSEFDFGVRFFYPLAAVFALPFGPTVEAFLNSQPRKATRAGFGLIAILVLAVELPLQVAGMSVHVVQAIEVSRATGNPQWVCQLQLLRLKLERGISAEETYRTSDFMSLAAEATDEVLDYRQKTSYQFLNHWWSILLAGRCRSA